MSDQETYPQYEADGSELLSYPNIWRGEPSPVVGLDCFNPTAQIYNDENLITLKLTAQQFTEMYSALYLGAEIAYPDRFMQIIVNFLAGIHCPPILEDQECFNYPSYAAFLEYIPQNPFTQPDTIPEGYLTPTFVQVTADNLDEFPGYEINDIVVPFGAFTLDVNWFDDISGQLPTIQIHVQGEGDVNIKLLNIVQGGLVVVTVDNPPDILDIIGGIVTAADNILDTNLDIVSLPPETAKEIIYDVHVSGAGEHIVYCVFFPIIDDSLLPLRFGGGFRGVELCNFVESPVLGITDMRFNPETCNLEQFKNGAWTVVTDWEAWLDCIPSSGGGGGSANILTTPFVVASGLETSTNTTYDNVPRKAFFHTFTASKALIVWSVLVNNSVNGTITSIRPKLGGSGWTVTEAEEAITGNTARSCNPNALFESIPTGVSTQVYLEMKTGSGGTAQLTAGKTATGYILEFEDASALSFVEDIRIVGNELQKKIGGVWITVSASLGDLLDAIQATADLALARADSAIATNTSQQTQINTAITTNNTQNTRLDALEAADISQQAELDDHESRITALEAADTSIDARLDSLEFLILPRGYNAIDYDFTGASMPASVNILTGTFDSGDGVKFGGGFGKRVELEFTAGGPEVTSYITAIKVNIESYSNVPAVEFAGGVQFWDEEIGSQYCGIPSQFGAYTLHLTVPPIQSKQNFRFNIYDILPIVPAGDWKITSVRIFYGM